jgi:hypothetical protein
MAETAPPPRTDEEAPPDPFEQPEAEAARLRTLGRQWAGATGPLILVLLALLVYFALTYGRLDRVGEGDFQVPYRQHLQEMVTRQAALDREAFGDDGDSAVPHWPTALYDKHRRDVYFAAGMAILIALVLVLLAETRRRREQTILDAAREREIRALARRVSELEQHRPDPS